MDLTLCHCEAIINAGRKYRGGGRLLSPFLRWTVVILRWLSGVTVCAQERCWSFSRRFVVVKDGSTIDLAPRRASTARRSKCSPNQSTAERNERSALRGCLGRCPDCKSLVQFFFSVFTFLFCAFAVLQARNQPIVLYRKHSSSHTCHFNVSKAALLRLASELSHTDIFQSFAYHNRVPTAKSHIVSLTRYYSPSLLLRRRTVSTSQSGCSFPDSSISCSEG
jgi:hypothetical protein